MTSMPSGWEQPTSPVDNRNLLMCRGCYTRPQQSLRYFYFWFVQIWILNYLKYTATGDTCVEKGFRDSVFCSFIILFLSNLDQKWS